MNETLPPAAAQFNPAPVQPRSTWKRNLLITLCVLLGVFGVATASLAYWYQTNLNASPFKPVALTAPEQQALDAKVAVLTGTGKGATGEPVVVPAATDPSKTIVLNEREINAWLQAQNLGETVKVSIRDGGIGATILAPVEKDVPVFGGHTIRLQVLFNTKLDENRRFALSLADVNVGGISLPNDWLGNLKGVNLLTQHSGTEDPALKAFAAGIKDFQMKNGEIRVVLND